MSGDVEEALAGFRVDDPEFIADPYPALGALREAAPIVHHGPSDRWLVTRFEDVASSLRSRALGRIYEHRYDHADVGRDPPDPRWSRFAEHERWSLLSLEPPDHTRLRRLISQVFTPSAVAGLAGTVEGFSTALLDDCEGAGTFDLLADYAQPYSVAVICSMLGVPASDTRLLLDWSHAIVKMYELEATDETRRRADDAAGAFISYVHELIAEKRRRPDGLLVSELAAVEDHGDVLTEAEIASTTMVLLEAGHEATVNTLGNGFRALMHHRDQWERLTSGEVPPAVAVEELLRWDSPLQLFERFVLEPDVEVAGQPLEVGQELALLFGSAQRDPRRFDRPDTFDVARDDPAHIGFGGGLHFCIGAPLARLELTTSIAGLAARFPHLELVDEPTYQPAFVIRGLEALALTSGR